MTLYYYYTVTLWYHNKVCIAMREYHNMIIS